jgi:hypothetical protein
MRLDQAVQTTGAASTFRRAQDESEPRPFDIPVFCHKAWWWMHWRGGYRDCIVGWRRRPECPRNEYIRW